MFSTRRVASAVGAVLLAGSTLVGCGTDPSPGADSASGSPSPTAAAPGSEAATRAADWLAGELTGGLLSYTTQFGPFTDVGMSIDAAVALDAVGDHGSEVSAVADGVAENLATYVEFPSGKGTHVNAGAVAKAAVLAQVAGEDPTAFAGRDLVADLEEVTTDSGRIADSFPRGAKGDADYANVIGQVYAVRALSTADSAEAGVATGFLLDQQCDQGWFRLTFSPDPQASGQACEDDPQAQPDPDTTALAVVHLAALAQDDPTVADAVQEAVSWLAQRQAPDGSLTGSRPATANTNTTGLAGWAFGETGRTEEAESAAAWIARLQADSGAVPFDEAGSTGARNGTIPRLARMQWLLATTQAAPALRWSTD